MKDNGHTIKESLHDIADDTRALIAATADATEEKVVEARNRLNDALHSAKATYNYVQKKAVKSAKAADEIIRDKPYHAIGVAFGVGAVLGFLLSRRNR